MKKPYINPQVQIFEVQGGTILEASGKFDEGSDGTQLIKQDRTNREYRDVWDDDWSKE